MGSKERFYVDVMALQAEVTGSCNLVIVKFPDGSTTKFIVDCGLFQEKDYQKYNLTFPFNSNEIEFALITHNHVDHIGRLPLLTKKGFNNKIYCTNTTKLFMPLALFDSYKVIKETAKWNHTKELYSEGDVTHAISLTQGCKYGQPVCITPNIKATFFINGHLLGAAMILVQISYAGHPDINLFFTGDYNNKNMFFDVEELPKWVLNLPLTIVQESTYGDMDSSEIRPCFEDNIIKCMERKKTAVCMVFSLGRSQEILYILKKMQDNGTLDSAIPIYFDGKLAIKYTDLYLKVDIGIKKDMLDFLPKNLSFVDKISRPSVLADDNVKIILTTSGMGTYGPAQVYIPEYISRRNCLLQFTGYTAEGTLGEKLKSTEIGGIVPIRGVMRKKLAEVEYTTQFSAHAKADEMIANLKKFTNIKFILVTHGESSTEKKFSERILKEVETKNVAILNREYLFRITPYGLMKSLTTSFL